MPRLLILSLGSNLGNRTSVLCDAIADLSLELGKLQGLSPVYETEPFAVGNHPPYLNLVAAFSCVLDAESVLAITQQIEKKSGRTSKGDLSPRLLDIDLISFGNLQIQNDQLVLPHPRMCLRKFVLQPLSDVCPRWKHPVTGEFVTRLLDACSDSSWVNLHSFIPDSLKGSHWS